MKKLSSLSAFLPCYNEAANIPLLVADLLDVLPQVARRFEIIIVNDGSRDKTLAVARRLHAQHSEVRVVNHADNAGYGSAVYSGLTAAQYDWVFLTDGDRQFDVNELKKLVPFTDKYQAVLGYRKNRAEGWRRHLNAQLFKLYITTLFRIKARDIDCAFKLIKRDVIPLAQLRSRGAMISTEILYYLRKKRIKVKELPVTHYPRQYGVPTGNHPRVIAKALVESLQLRWRLLTS